MLIFQITSNDHPSEGSGCPVAPFSDILFSLYLHRSQLVTLRVRFGLTHTITYQHIAANLHVGCIGQKQTIILFIFMLRLPGCISVWKSLEIRDIGRVSAGSAWSKSCSSGQKSFTFLIHSGCGSRSVPCSLGPLEKTCSRILPGQAPNQD